MVCVCNFELKSSFFCSLALSLPYFVSLFVSKSLRFSGPSQPPMSRLSLFHRTPGMYLRAFRLLICRHPLNLDAPRSSSSSSRSQISDAN